MFPLGEGWDSFTFLVNDSVVCRIPKRSAVAKQMACEIDILRVVRRYVSVNVPDISYIGPRLANMPLSLTGYPLIEGVPLQHLADHVERQRFFPLLGEFLSELHSIPLDALPRDVLWFRWTGEVQAGPVNGWEEGLRGFCARIQNKVLPLLRDNTRRTVTREIVSFINRPEHFAFQPVLIHGDFAAEHILVDTETGRVTGIIDFGDCGLGDPAYDVWPELNPYYTRPVDDTFFVRQRFYRRFAPFHGALFGLQTGDDKLVQSSLCEIENMLGA